MVSSGALFIDRGEKRRPAAGTRAAIRKSGRIWARVAALTFVIAAVLGEIGVRTLASDRYLHIRHYRVSDLFHFNPATTRFDMELGFRTIPNLDYRFRNANFDTRVRTNSMGFRDDEQSLEDPEFLFLGDSFVFGWGAEDGETVVDLFERETGKTCLNMGQVGYGTLQEVILYDRTVDSFWTVGQKAVLIVFDNDFMDIAQPFYSPYPTLRKKGGELIWAPPVEDAYRAGQMTQTPGLHRTLARISALYDLLTARFHPWPSVTLPEESPHLAERKRLLGERLTEKEAFETGMRMLGELTVERQTPLYAFYVPAPACFHDRYPPHTELFEEVLFKLSIPHLDLSDVFEEEDYFPSDGHWRPSGTHKAASEIARFLRKID